MNQRVLTSRQNPWIKKLCRLHRAADRKELKLFLCEGTHLVEEAIATRWPINAICFTHEWAEQHRALFDSLPTDIRKQEVNGRVLEYLSTTNSPDGVIAVARLRNAVIDIPSITLGLAVERVQEPGNLGALIRVSVATGADGIWISPDSVDVYHPKVLRASAGQWFRQPIITSDLEPWIDCCRDQTIQILAAAAGGRWYWEFDLTRPTVFLFGNEGAGLSASLLRIADDVISVPMANGVESLNVGTTGGLLLYEAMRQRHIL